MSREAACSFTVTLTGFALSVKKIDAIGDSFTEGQNGRIAFVDLPNAYPTRLQALLDAAYPGQNIVVVNRGIGGEPLERTVDELPGDLSADRPEAVLLLGGYNNLTNGCGKGPANATACQKALEAVQFAVRDSIRRSHEYKVSFVFVSTLTPPGPVLPGAPRDRRISNDAILQANARIRQIAATEGATLVDVYPAFVGHEADYTDTDGLHLKPEGYQAIADAFFAAIRTTIPQTPLPASLR